jgi:hypothetical protein
MISFKTRDITCLDCKSIGQIADWEYCENYVCAGCGCIHRVVGIDVNRNGKTEIPSGFTKFIPLGAKLKWNEDEFLVCGFSVKSDQDGYKWHEYAAINNKGGHVHISQFNGHWNIIETVDDILLARLKGSGLLDLTFPVWNRYKARTVGAVGSFPYDVKKWTKYQVVEHILPPHILIEETSGQTIKYLGTYVSPKDLQKKLDKEIVLPYRTGVGANQLFNPLLNPVHWWVASVVLLLLMFLSDFGFNSAAAKEIVLDSRIEISDSTQGHPIVTESFTISPGISAMRFSASSDVSNDWVELGIELVNESNNNSRSFIIGMERYSGMEGGYSWSEGSGSGQEYLCSVVSGKYHLIITPMKSKTPHIFKARLTVEDDVSYSTDVYILAGFMFLISIIVSVYKFFFEKNRWSSSPYSPYTTE